MKRTIILSIVVVNSAFLILVPKAKASEKHECTLATLEGRYLATGNGERAPGAIETDFPRVIAGVWVFDGEGNISWLETSSRGGEIRHRTTGTGTYTLDSNCIGTVVIGANTADIFVSRDGRVVNLIRTDEGVIATRSFNRDTSK